MRANRASLGLILVAALSAGVAATVLGGDEPSSPLTDSPTIESAGSLPESWIAPYNSGEADYLDLPLVAGDDYDAPLPLTLEMLTTWSDVAFVARVVDIKWEVEARSFPMKIVSYAPPEQLVYGIPPKPLQIRGRDAGPYGDELIYMVPRYGVREKTNEVYLVFSAFNERTEQHIAVFHGGFILLDGSRIAESDAAKELAIEGRKVDDVVAELRRLKGE